jgi:Cu(I)/Ag(I) efflux system membrane fusion protein
MKPFISLLSILFAAGVLISGCGSKGEGHKSTESAGPSQTSSDYYTCPMHPSVKSDKPGICPICHMTLVRVSQSQDGAESAQLAGSVILSQSKLVLANISTVRAESRSLLQSISMAGKIDYPETNTQQVTTRFAGRIEILSVSFVGQHVRRGDPVAELYSPDAITAQREFLVALSSSPVRKQGTEGSAQEENDLVQQSRSKLRFWGFTDSQIEELASTRTVKTLVTIHSPVSGTIIRKNVELQQYIAAGDPLFDVADLQTVWLQMDAYESDLGSLKIGQAITATIDAFPSEEFKGTVSFIGAVVEPSTRTVRVRATLGNKDLKLKPEMFARAVIHIPLAKAIVVPSSAVIATGKHSVVWVEVSAGHFEARPVKLGRRSDDFYQVLGGLSVGESIAVSGGYLIDSESQLQLSATGEAGH